MSLLQLRFALAAAAFLTAGSERHPSISGSKSPVMCAVSDTATNTTIRNTREKEFGSMRSLHRGDIYQVRFAPTVFYPSGAPGYVLIMKNDDGSIPCETADVILVNPVCNVPRELYLVRVFALTLGGAFGFRSAVFAAGWIPSARNSFGPWIAAFMNATAAAPQSPCSCRSVLHWEGRINPAIPVKLVVEVSLWKTQFRLGIRPMRFIGYFAGISPWRM